MKQLMNAQKAKKVKPEVYLLMGECYLELGDHQEAIHSFFKVVKLRPKSVTVWEALVRALFKVQDFDEAINQINIAETHFEHKPVFNYYRAAILLAQKKLKESLLVLEDAISSAPRMFKKFLELQPNALQMNSVAELVAKYKKKPK